MPFPFHQFSNRLWKKIFLGYLVLLLLFVVGTALTYYDTVQEERHSRDIIKVLQPMSRKITEIRLQVDFMNNSMLVYLLTKDDNLIEQFHSASQRVTTLLAELAAMSGGLHNTETMLFQEAHLQPSHFIDDVTATRAIHASLIGRAEDMIAISPDVSENNLVLQKGRDLIFHDLVSFSTLAKDMNQAALESANPDTVYIGKLIQVMDSWQKMRTQLAVYTVSPTSRARKVFETFIKATGDYLDDLGHLDTTDQLGLQELRLIYEHFSSNIGTVIAPLSTNRWRQDVVWLKDDYLVSYNILQSQLYHLNSYLDQAIQSSGKHLITGVKQIRINTLLFIFLGTMVALIMAYVFANRIAKPIRALQDASKQVADGDLDVSIPVGSNDEIGHLARVFNHMLQNLKALYEDKDTLLKQLQSRSRELEILTDALDKHAIVSITDRAGNIIYVNDKFCEVSQYSYDELLGQNHRILNSGYFTPDFWQNMWRTIGKGEIWQHEVRNRRKDGGHYWVESSIMPVPGPDGRPEKYVSIRTDITQLKETEDALRQVNEELEQRVLARTTEIAVANQELNQEKQAMRAILHASSSRSGEDFLKEMIQQIVTGLHVDMVVIGRLNGDSGNRVETLAVHMNNANQPNYCYTAHATPCAEVLRGETVCFPDGVAQSFPQDTFLAKENINAYLGIPMFYSDGRVLGHISVYNKSALNNPGWQTSLLTIFAELAASGIERQDYLDELKRAYRMKSEFLANMSHELRTPLHAILSFANIGQRKIDTANKDKLQNYFGRIQQSGERLLNLLSDLLDVSKLEAGMMRYDMTDNNLYDVFVEIIEELDAMLREKNVTVRHNNPAIPADLCFDRLRIGQVLRNLLSNAIKFSPPDTTINVEYHGGEYKLHDNDFRQGVFLRISDQGAGIPEGELKSIFQGFTQSTTTRSGAGGTGLGLTICRDIITAHGGVIWAENNPDGGACMKLFLPYKQQQATREAV